MGSSYGSQKEKTTTQVKITHMSHYSNYGCGTASPKLFLFTEQIRVTVEGVMDRGGSTVYQYTLGDDTVPIGRQWQRLIYIITKGPGREIVWYSHMHNSSIKIRNKQKRYNSKVKTWSHIIIIIHWPVHLTCRCSWPPPLARFKLTLMACPANRGLCKVDTSTTIDPNSLS